MKDFLNLGCGNRFHPSWTNLDLAPCSPEVQKFDLLEGIPFPTERFDVVYQSHVIEHLPRPCVPRFLQECFRVLRPGGILRLATPDLERLAREYLERLGEALEGGPEAHERYQWILVELFDQMTREQSGGAMLEMMRAATPSLSRYIRDRIGEEAASVLDGSKPPTVFAAPRTWQGLVKDLAWKIIGRLRGPAFRRAHNLGVFRMSGEIHHWLYDRHSLSRILIEAGFVQPCVREATESEIPKWDSFHLDALPDGRTIKPDSIFVEARKP